MKDKLKQALAEHRKVIRAASVSMKNRRNSETKLQRAYVSVKLEHSELKVKDSEVTELISEIKYILTDLQMRI